MEIFTAEADCKRTFTVSAPIFTPFYNEWGANVYYQTQAFDRDPLRLWANSTPGSPVILAQGLFIGFLNAVGGRVAFDGVRTLTLSLEAGQTVMICEGGDPYEAWEQYNARFDTARPKEKFWNRLEYCTWVDQRRAAELTGRHGYDFITEERVYAYMDRIEKLGLPKGKLTIDDGWSVLVDESGRKCHGNWEIDRAKFPHFEQLIADMTERGYTPGLWFAPFSATRNSEIALANPGLLTEDYIPDRDQYFFNYDETVLRPYYHNLFERFIRIGIRKFKMDIAYGPKDLMIALLRLMSEEIRAIDPTVEIESHMPDIFAVPYADTVRLNDVSLEMRDWGYVTCGHFEVCRHSAAGRILNLDHIAGNSGLPTAQAYMKHWHLLRSFLLETESYPVISNLPDLYDEAVSRQFVEEICALYDADGYRK